MNLWEKHAFSVKIKVTWGKQVRGVNETIRFIHSADLHLDRPFTGLSKLGDQQIDRIKKSAFLALDKLVDLAISEEVHFVVIVGDVFDQMSTTIFAEVKFKQALEKLNQQGIYVYISFGNHDYHQTGKMTFDYLEHVYVFNQQSVSAFTYKSPKGTTVNLQGFSYKARHVTDDLSDGFKVVDTCDYQIGMLHGSAGTSSEHETYAPFQLSKLKALGFDYFALGHIHQRQVLSENPPIVYSGNIQGGSKKETGDKGCMLVELTPTGTEFRFHPLQSIYFDTVEIDGAHIFTFDDLIHTLKTVLNDQSADCLLSIILQNPTSHFISLYHEEGFTDVIRLINENLSELEKAAYLLDITLKQPPVRLNKYDPFLDSLKDQFEDKNLSGVYELFQHQRARRFLNQLSDEDLAIASDEAFNYLYYELIGGKGNED